MATDPKLDVGKAARAAKRALITLAVYAPLWPIMKLGEGCSYLVKKGMDWANR